MVNVRKSKGADCDFKITTDRQENQDIIIYASGSDKTWKTTGSLLG
jgi:hypothetical protein